MGINPPLIIETVDSLPEPPFQTVEVSCCRNCRYSCYLADGSRNMWCFRIKIITNPCYVCSKWTFGEQDVVDTYDSRE